MGLIRLSESDEQTAIFDWARFCSGRIPELNLLYHVPNGGFRTKTEAAKFQSEGVKAGVPDLVLPVARNGYHALYIELKAKDGKVSDIQKKWLNDLRYQGNCALACFGADEAISVIEKYLKGEL